MFDTYAFANGILARTFERREFVEPHRLMLLGYLTNYVFIHEVRPSMLPDSGFVAGRDAPVGPALLPVLAKFRSNMGAAVVEYVRDSRGHYEVLGEDCCPGFGDCVAAVLDATSELSTFALCTALCEQGSAYARAVSNGAPVLEVADIAVDPSPRGLLRDVMA